MFRDLVKLIVVLVFITGCGESTVSVPLKKDLAVEDVNQNKPFVPDWA